MHWCQVESIGPPEKPKSSWRSYGAGCWGGFQAWVMGEIIIHHECIWWDTYIIYKYQYQYIYIYTYINTHMYIYIYMSIHTHIYTNTHIYIYRYQYTHIYTYQYISCVYIYIYYQYTYTIIIILGLSPGKPIYENQPTSTMFFECSIFHLFVIWSSFFFGFSHGFAPPSGVLLAAQATATEDSQRALSESLWPGGNVDFLVDQCNQWDVTAGIFHQMGISWDFILL